MYRATPFPWVNRNRPGTFLERYDDNAAGRIVIRPIFSMVVFGKGRFGALCRGRGPVAGEVNSVPDDAGMSEHSGNGVGYVGCGIGGPEESVRHSGDGGA